MRNTNMMFVLALLLTSLCSAQQKSASSSPDVVPGPVLGGDGTRNYIALWTTPSYLQSSVIYQSGASIGIGTTSPATTLDVNGNINAATSYEIGGNELLTIGRLADNNLFLGVNAGKNNVAGHGTQNTFVGAAAGFNSTTAVSNTFVGEQAGFSDTTGSSDTFIGTFSGYSNVSGMDNTFTGFAAGEANTNGYSNTFLGSHAGSSNTQGIGNTFTGTAAGQLNTTGSNNSSYGLGAGIYTTEGNGNDFLGTKAGYNNTTGSNDVYIANLGPASGAESNTIRIGGDVGLGYGSQTATYIAGIYGSTSSGGIPVYINSSGQLGTLTSSMRFKEQVQDMGDSTDALMELRPVTFLYKPEYAKGERTLQYGLIAEEVAKVYPELVAYDSNGQPYSVRYQYLAPMLVNELQRQHHRAEAQAEVIQAQQQEIDQLEQRLSRLEKLVGTHEQVATVQEVK